MSHSDDKGLVLPPAIAPYHVVIVPIWKNDEDKKIVETYINEKIIAPLKKSALKVASTYL